MSINSSTTYIKLAGLSRQHTLDDEDDSFNYSAYNFPKEKWITISKFQIIIKITAFTPVLLFGIMGNLILLNIICRNRSLRTPTNLLIANMATADMATLLICPILFMFHDFFQNYQLGAFGCKIEGFIEGSLLVTAVLNLCAVSYDRLTAIVLPLEAKLTIRGSKIVMFCTWISGMILSVPLVIYRTYKERIWKDFVEAYCSENPTVLRMYWHVLIVTLVWFPLGVMVICYSAIFHKLDRYEKKVLKREHPMSVSYKMKVAKTLFIVVVIFVLLRMPFNVLIFIRDQMLINLNSSELNSSFRILWYTAHFLMFVNAAVNPLIYGLKNDNFRRAYHQTPLIPCICKPKPIRRRAQKPNNFARLFHGKLQPRGPCGEDRFAGIKSLFNTKDTKQFSTKTTNLKQITTRNDLEANNNNNNENCLSKFQYKDDCCINNDSNCMNSNGFI